MPCFQCEKVLAGNDPLAADDPPKGIGRTESHQLRLSSATSNLELVVNQKRSLDQAVFKFHRAASGSIDRVRQRPLLRRSLALRRHIKPSAANTGHWVEAVFPEHGERDAERSGKFDGKLRIQLCVRNKRRRLNGTPGITKILINVVERLVYTNSLHDGSSVSLILGRIDLICLYRASMEILHHLLCSGERGRICSIIGDEFDVSSDAHQPLKDTSILGTELRTDHVERPDVDPPGNLEISDNCPIDYNLDPMARNSGRVVINDFYTYVLTKVYKPPKISFTG